MFLKLGKFFAEKIVAGEALFKRGWRLTHGEAPLKENLAAGLLMLSGWTPEKPLIDPFCGSGTIAIEAAHMALNVPPGLNRRFAFEKLTGFGGDLWDEMLEDARAGVNRHAKVTLRASDISSLVVEKGRGKTRAARGSRLFLPTDASRSRRATPAERGPKRVLPPGLVIRESPPTANSRIRRARRSAR